MKRLPSPELTRPIRTEAASTASTFGKTLRPCLKPMATASADRASFDICNSAMTKAVCSISLGENDSLSPLAAMSLPPDEPPTRSPLAHKAWEIPHQENLTGTDAAYAPPGSIRRAAPAARRDYEAWQPE